MENPIPGEPTNPIPPAPPAAPLPPPPAPVYAPVSPSDERTWAMLAHMSILLNLFTGFLGPIAALAIYLAFKDRSRYISYHSLQAFLFQLITWVGGGFVIAIAWTISGILTAIVIGLCLMPIACLLSFVPLAAVVYGVFAGVETSQGKDFRYWLIGDWIRGTLEG